MSRLPIPGQDTGTWGDVLNDYLSQSIDSDGTLKPSALTSAGAVSTINSKTPTSGAILLGIADLTDVSGASSATNNQVLAYNTGSSKWAPTTVSGSASDATTGTKGIVQLAGDLGGTSTSAAAPTLASTTNVNAIISANPTVAGAAQKSANLSDVASTSTALANLGGLSAATAATTYAPRRTFDVKVYGATGNGATDDTTAIQAAIAAAHTVGGGRVYFDVGNYKISSALQSYANISLEGANGGGEYNGTPCAITQTSTTANGITVANAWGVTIKNLSLIGPGSGSGIGIDLDYTSVPSGFNGLDDVYITGFGGDGLYMHTPILTTLSRVWSVGNGGYGIHINGGTSVTANSCWAPSNGTGGWFVNANYCSFNGCAADSNTGYGWTISGSQSCSFNACGAEVNTSGGITFVSGCFTCTVNGMWVSNKGTGYNVDGSCYRIVLSGCLENPLVGAAHGILTASGSIVTIINRQTTTANSYGGFANQVVDNGFTSIGAMSAMQFNATGRAGAQTAGASFVGGTASGHPVSGTFYIGEFIVDETGSFWICTASGSPGTWVQISGYVATGSTSLVGGTVIVSNTSITANSTIKLASQALHGTPGALFVSAKTAGTSFTISSTSASDTSVVEYFIVSY